MPLPKSGACRRDRAAGLALFALLVAVGGVAGGQEAAAPVPPRDYRLRLALRGKERFWPGRKTGVVEFHHGGLAAADGADVVAVDANGRLSLRVLQAGPGTFLRIAFAYRNAADVSLAFGQEAAGKRGDASGNTAEPTLPRTPASSDWRPPAGLLLTTRPLPAGAKADSWKQMRRILATARERGMYGRGCVDRVFHGYHAFAAAESFVSIYRGWLGCPRSGRYVFATSSDDASFLLVDGRLVVAWPGAHGAVWDARHQRAVKLSKGVHAFSYYHLNFAGPTIACAAWKPPGAKKIWPIAAASFAPVSRFRARSLCKTGAATNDRPLPFLRVLNLGETWVAGVRLLRFAFEIPGAGECGWSLGDGCRGRGARVEHVYLSAGLRRVVARVGPRKREVVNQVMIQPLYARQVQRRIDRPGPYLALVAASDFAALTSGDLFLALRVLEGQSRHAAAFAAAGSALLARKNLDARTCYRATLLFGKHLRNELRRPREAIALYRRTLARKDMGRERTAHLLREVGDTYLYFLKDNDAALNEYDKVVGRYADVLEANIVRVTKIKIGDIFRERGDGAKARAAYLEAEGMKLCKRNFFRDTVRKGALYKTVDDYLRRGRTDAARKWLEILEWEYPMEKLDGYSSIASARIAEAEKNDLEAIKQLLWLVKANPRGAYAAEAFYRLARIYARGGRGAEAQKVADKLQRDYADSPYAVRVTTLLRAGKKTPAAGSR